MSGYGFCYDPYNPGWGGREQPGARVLMDFILEKFRTAISFGILRDRDRCGKSSTHCYGRGGDVGNRENGKQVNNHPDGSLLAEWLIAEAGALGIQRVIWGGEPGEHDWEWDSRPGQRHKSLYHGPSHDDHVHWELCWSAARELTREQVQEAYDRYFGDKEDDVSAEDVWNHPITNLVVPEGKDPIPTPAHKLVTWAHHDANTAMRAVRDLAKMTVAISKQLEDHTRQAGEVDGVSVREYAEATVEHIGELLSKRESE